MLRVRLLGELRLELEGRRLDDIASGRARSLLAWLAYRPGLHQRTQVASLFWPDVLESSARASLRTTLATLRRELGEAAGAHVVAERERVGMPEGPELWVDVREIDRLIAAGRARRRAGALWRGAAGRPRRRLGPGGAPGAPRARGRSARGPRPGRGGGGRHRSGADPRAQPARARPRVGGCRARADAPARPERRPRGRGGGLRGLSRRAAARAGHGAVRRDARAGRAAARGGACAGRRPAGAARAARARPRRRHAAGGPRRAARRAACRLAAREQRAGGGGDGSRRGRQRQDAAARGAGRRGSRRRRHRARRPLHRGRRRAVRAVPRGAAALRDRRRPERFPAGCSASSLACCPSWRPTAGRPGTSRRTLAIACSRPWARRSDTPPARPRCC